jgi:hypothetical protein
MGTIRSVSASFTGQMRAIRLDTVIAAPIGECFRLSLSVDADAASMHASGEQAIRGVTSGVMKLGDQVTWRACHLGIVFQMTSAITEYQAPSRFVDEQQHGPFRRWWHEHTFTTLANGQSQMTDLRDAGLLPPRAPSAGSSRTVPRRTHVRHSPLRGPRRPSW